MDNQLVTYGAVAAVFLILVLVLVVSQVVRRKPKVLVQAYYQEKWTELQSNLRDTKTWPLAIIEADKLLDDALKKRKFKGKTMGERLVAAQRELTRNDAVWFAHKLRNRLVHEQNTPLREKDVKAALIGFRQALRDLGAL